MNARLVLVLTVLVAAPAPAAAGAADLVGPVGDPSEVHQNDGGTGGDAADTCEEARDGENPDLEPGDPAEGGQLVPAPRAAPVLGAEAGIPPADNADHWRLPIQDVPADNEAHVVVATRTPLRVGLHAGLEVAVTVYDPGCEPLERVETTSDGLDVVTFPVVESGTFVVGLETRFRLADLAASGPPGALAASGHCAPYCLAEYQMAVGS